jgi:hypothetical protein
MNKCVLLGEIIKTGMTFKSPVFLMKTSIFRDIIRYSKVRDNWHLGGAYGLHHQGQGVSQARDRHETGSKQGPYAGFLLGLLFHPDDGDEILLQTDG